MLAHLPWENLRMSHPSFKNNSCSKNSRHADGRDLPAMWRHGAAAETRSGARIKTNFLFLVHELNRLQKTPLDRIITVGGVRNGALWQRIMKLRVQLVGYQTFILIKQNSSGFNLNWLGISSLFHVKRECPNWKQKTRERPMWFWHGECAFFCEGNKGGRLIHLIPSCHCGRGCMYCRAGCHGNSCGVRKSFFPPSHPPPPPPPLLSFCPVPCQLSASLSPSFSFPLSDLYRHGLQSFGWGMFRYAFAHTHIICLCAAGIADQGTMSLKKRLSFKRTWNFNTVSKLRFAERASSSSSVWSRGDSFCSVSCFSH